MNLLWYWMIEPQRGALNDTGRNAALTQAISMDDGSQLDVSIYLDVQMQPHFVRVRAFGAVDLDDTLRFRDQVLVLAEHMLSVLKLTWDSRTSYYPMNFFCRESEDGTGAQILLEETGERVFSCKAVQSLFIHTVEARQSLRLITDSLDTRIPIQYRFLSLYKFLEIRYRNDKDHWDWDALNTVCEAQIEPFERLNLGRTLRGEIEHLRDSCAHIRSGKGGKRQLGVTALHPKALRDIEKFMPIMTEICRSIFNDEMDGKIGLSPTAWVPRFST